MVTIFSKKSMLRISILLIAGACSNRGSKGPDNPPSSVPSEKSSDPTHPPKGETKPLPPPHLETSNPTGPHNPKQNHSNPDAPQNEHPNGQKHHKPVSVLSSTNPTDKSENIAINQRIAMTFSGPIKNLTEDQFEITPKVPGKLKHVGSMALFAPEHNLDPNTKYTVSVKNIQDLNGKALTDLHSWEFRTGNHEDKTAPHIKEENGHKFIFPGPDAKHVSTDASFSVEFDKAIASAKLNFLEIKNENKPSPESIDGIVDGNKVYFPVHSKLKPASHYKMTIHDITDLAGNEAEIIDSEGQKKSYYESKFTTRWDFIGCKVLVNGKNTDGLILEANSPISIKHSDRITFQQSNASNIGQIFPQTNDNHLIQFLLYTTKPGKFTARVTKDAVESNGIMLAEDFSCEFDTEPPTVITKSPEGESSGNHTSIEATFSKPIQKDVGNIHVYANNKEIPGEVTYTEKSIRFTPNHPFEKHIEHSVKVKGVKDLSSIIMDELKDWNFIPVSGPRVTKTIPSGNFTAIVPHELDVEFNEAINMPNKGSIRLRDTTANTDILATAEIHDSKTLRIRPTSQLTDRHQYTIDVDGIFNEKNEKLTPKFHWDLKIQPRPTATYKTSEVYAGSHMELELEFSDDVQINTSSEQIIASYPRPVLELFGLNGFNMLAEVDPNNPRHVILKGQATAADNAQWKGGVKHTIKNINLVVHEKHSGFPVNLSEWTLTAKAKPEKGEIQFLPENLEQLNTPIHVIFNDVFVDNRCTYVHVYSDSKNLGFKCFKSQGKLEIRNGKDGDQPWPKTFKISIDPFYYGHSGLEFQGKETTYTVNQ